MKKVTFLVSGNGGNLKYIYLLCELNIIENMKISVVSDRECGALDFSNKVGLDTYIINYSKENNSELILALEKIEPDVIVTNWHKILCKDVVEKYKGKLINLHYSLLPEFAGLIGIKPIQEAYNTTVTKIGATCHYVIEEVDAGDIISQKAFAKDIPIETAIEIMFREGCYCLLEGLFSVLDLEIPSDLPHSNDSVFWHRLSDI